MKKISFILLIILIVFISLSFTEPEKQKKHNYIPEEGYVPDSITALRIADAILEPIYGREKIEKEKPFYVKLIDDKVWLVAGNPKWKQGQCGGVAIIEIRKSDCKILRVTHGM